MTMLSSFSKALVRSTRLGALLLVAGLPLLAVGQDDGGTKPVVTIVVPFPPGAGADNSARMLAERLSVELSQRVLVDNKPGADGNIAIAHVAQARPDGLTLLYANPTVVYNHMITSLDIDGLKALEPIAKVTEYSLVLLLSGARSPANFSEFMTWAKERQSPISCGGGGGAPTITCHMLRHYGQLPVTFVPYKGNAPAMRDLMGGHLDIMFDLPNSASAQMGSNKVTALATTSETRSEPPFAHLPVLRKTMPQFRITSWLGFFAPAGVPAEQLKRLDRAFTRVLADPDFQARLIASGLPVKHENAQQFRKSLQSDRQHYEQVFRDIRMSKPN